MPAQSGNNNKTKTDSYILSDFSGRFDTLGENLMKLSSNSHICTIYRKDEDKINSIMEFLKTGIVKNERCVIIVDKESKEDILTKIKSLKEIRNLLNTSAIAFVDSEEVFGNKSDFNLAKTIESIGSYLESPQEDNFNGLMLIIEILPLKNKNTTFNIITELHSNIDKLISNRDINFFCLYNEYKFESKTLLDVIITHSKLIFNGYLCQNSLFMNPYQLQLTRKDKLNETIYKKAVYEIVQGEITKQKRVEKDSFIKAETLKGIDDSVFILDFAGNILEVNEAAYKTRGYTEEEMLSLNILNIMTSENRDLFDSRIEELKNKGEITFETTHHCKYGSVLDVEFKTKIISFDNQQFILSVGRDITERKRIEKEARISAEKYIRIFNNANDAIFLSKRDESGRFDKIIEVNDLAVKMYGYSKDELYKMKPRDFNTSGLEETEGFLSKIFEEKTLRFERSHKTKDGKIIDVDISSQLFELDGETVSLAIVRDITDRKEAEKELKKSETLYRSIFETVGTANVILDENQNILQMNSIMVDLMGYTKEETIGKKKWIEFILPTELPKLLEYNRKRLENPSSIPKRYETRIKNRAGEVRDLSISVDIIPGTRKIFASATDISEQKKLEKERKSVEKQLQLMKDSLDSSLSGIAVSDMNDKIIYVNNAYLQLWGYETSEELLGKGVEQILPYTHTTTKIAEEAMYELITLRRWIGDIQSEKLDGSPIWVKMNLNLVYDQNDEPIARMASFLDVSNEKQIAKSLSESEEKFRVLFTEMKQIYALYEVIYNKKGDIEDAIIVEINPVYEKLVNKKREELIGKKTTEIFPRVKKQEVNPIAILGRSAITGETEISEYFSEDLGRWFLAKSFSPIKDHIAVLFEDVTEKRKMDEVLEKERKTTKQYLDIVNIILTVVDANENVILVNKKGCELLGYEQEEIIGKNWFDNFLPMRVREKTKEIFQELLAGKVTQSESHENLILTKDGEERLIAWDNTFIRDEEGKIISTLSSGKDVTEIRKTQRELEDSEEKFRMIFNNANDAVYLFGLDEDNISSNLIEVNDVACKMLGYTEDEFRNMSPNDLTSMENKKNVPEFINKLTSVKSLTFESVHLTKEGKRIPVEISSHTFLYRNKQMVLSIVRDISERKKSEEKLRRLNEELEEKVIQRTYQMETLYNIIKDISETFDLKEAMEIIAKYVSQLVDYDIIVQLITQEGLNLIQIGAPKGNKEVIDDFLKIVKEEFVEINPDASSNRDSTTIITSNEKKIQKISSHLSIPLIAEDKVVGYIVVGTEQEDAYHEEEIWFLYKIADNISHTLQRLKVILAAKDELETVLDHTSDGVILLNSHESVVMVNKAASRFLEMIKDSKTNRINNEMLDLGELKQIGKKELSLNGNTYYVSMSPIKSDFVHGWLLTIHDITEEREMQKKILHQERLATLGKMTGGIAHDFNNILASIIGAADFSLMNADNIESKEFLNLIIKQSERGASLIRQMLDFTRQTVIKPKAVSLLDFITEFSRVIRSSLPENIILSANTQDWTVFMDQIQLQQLFMNLILNSKDALVSGGKINITVEEIDYSKIVDFEEIEIDKNQEYIHLVIEDNGEGMNEQTKKMIFEPFFTTKDPGKGSGLGLAQVYGIVRQSNGYINVESELKVGTKVHIYIPKYEGLVEEEIVESASHGEGRILLVEDDEDVRGITKMMLENYGFRVVTAENGKIALDLYNDTFDLVLTDIIMPVMGGEKLIKKLLEINPQVKCLAMTGYSDVDVPEGIKVLNKPITTSKLVNYIQNELDQVDRQEKKVQNEKREDGG